MNLLHLTYMLTLWQCQLVCSGSCSKLVDNKNRLLYDTFFRVWLIAQAQTNKQQVSSITIRRIQGSICAQWHRASLACSAYSRIFTYVLQISRQIHILWFMQFVFCVWNLRLIPQQAASLLLRRWSLKVTWAWDRYDTSIASVRPHTENF